MQSAPFKPAIAAVVISLVILTLFLYSEPTSTLTGKAFSLTPNPANPAVGTAIRVDIIASGVTDLSGVQVDLRYNTSLLRYDSISEGTFLDGGNNGALLVGTVNVSNGVVRNIIVARLGSTGVTGTGTVASVFFTTLGTGTTAVQYDKLLLANSQGLPITDVNVSTIITIGPGANGTPPTTPGTPTASGITTTSVTLTWTGSTDASGIARYRVWQGAVNVVNTSSLTIGVGGLSANTTYQFSVSAVDNTNIEGVKSAVRSVTTAAVPTAPDTTPPTVSITTPAAGAVLADRVTVTATATDNIGVTRVEFIINRNEFDQITEAPYSTSLDTRDYNNGENTITVVAYDAAGNQRESEVVVLINNQRTTGGGGGGGGGGGTYRAPTTVAAVPLPTVPPTPALQKRTFNFADSSIGSLEVSYEGQPTGVQFTISVADAQKALAGDSKLAVLSSFQIASTGIPATAVLEQRVRVRVPKEWLSSNRISIHNVRLYRNVAGAWDVVPTAVETEANDAYYVTATSTDLTVFAIAGERSSESLESVAGALGTPLPEPIETQVPSSETLKSKRTLLFSLTIGLLTVILVGAAGLYLHGKHLERQASTTMTAEQISQTIAKVDIPTDAAAELESYSTMMRGQGASEETIKNALLASGWPKDVLDTYFGSKK